MESTPSSHRSSPSSSLSYREGLRVGSPLSQSKAIETGRRRKRIDAVVRACCVCATTCEPSVVVDTFVLFIFCSYLSGRVANMPPCRRRRPRLPGATSPRLATPFPRTLPAKTACERRSAFAPSARRQGNGNRGAAGGGEECASVTDRMNPLQDCD